MCMKVIPVKMRNIKASRACFVDDEDYEMLKNRKWSENGNGYPRNGFTNRILNPNKQQIFVMMHRVIMWSPDGMVIDHIDGNKLNNQKKNLRVCSPTDNKRNRGMSRRNTSGYKGVYWQRANKKWYAAINTDERFLNVGSFENKEDAARAYNAAASKYHGEFAKLNVIDN